MYGTGAKPGTNPLNVQIVMELVKSANSVRLYCGQGSNNKNSADAAEQVK